MAAYRIQPTTADLAKALWTQSPHASVFTNPDVLQVLSPRVDWWIAVKGDTPVCVWPVCLPDGAHVGLPDFTYHVGPLWDRDAHDMPAHRCLAVTTAVYNGFIEELLRCYGRIEASLPVGLVDVRAFDWWNYHEAGAARFRIQPRYTARIGVLQDTNDETLMAGFRELRRREIRRINSDIGPVLTNDWTGADIASLYIETFERQGIAVTDAELAHIDGLVGLVARGLGSVIACREPSGSRIAGAILLLYGHGVANMVLNLVATDWRQSGMAAWLLLAAIRTARAHGEQCFDFNGANSPARGDDKHSYGAAPVLYFDISLDPTHA